MSSRDAVAPDSERLARLLAVSRRLATESDLLPVLHFLLESAIALTGAERGFLLVSRNGILSCEASVPDLGGAPGPVPPHLSRTVLTRAQGGEAVLSSDIAVDERFRARASVRRLRLRSVMAVPFPCRVGASGVLYLDSRVSRTFFREEDLELIAAFAAQGSLAIDNAMLLAATVGVTTLDRALDPALPSEGVPDIASAQSGLIVDRAGSFRRRVFDGGRVGRRGELEPDPSMASTPAPGRALPRHPKVRETLIGSSQAMRKVHDLALRVASCELPVLIVGESGTGKEVLARTIHRASQRAACRFVAENCAAIPEQLIESELFGSLRGAFTGAESDREGLFRAADGGTLFLDEIGEMPVALQARLLRVLQEGEVRPVGASKAVPIDVRIIAATNRDPSAAIAARRLRLDLYYRLAGVTIEIPPLRDRREDIPALAAHFLTRSASLRATSALRLAPEALLRLAAYDWPGNVRELENEIERAAVLAQGSTIQAEDLSQRLTGAAPLLSARGKLPAERTMIEAALLAERGSVAGAARAIGWSRQKLYRRMLSLDVPRRYGHPPETGPPATDPRHS